MNKVIKKKKKEKLERSGRSRFTKTISFRASNELYKEACKKVGKKKVGKYCLSLLRRDIEISNPSFNEFATI